MLTAAYTLLIAFLMVSRLPVFSGKTVRMRVPPEMVLPVFVSVVFFIALLIGYPWHILSMRLGALSPEPAAGAGSPIATMSASAAAAQPAATAEAAAPSAPARDVSASP